MQWSLNGSVNWTAPRRIALAVTPILAIFILAAAVAATVTMEPRRGQEGFEVPVVTLLALAFIAVHWLHLQLISRTLKKNGS